MHQVGALAKQFGPQGVRVDLVSPGWIYTDRLEEALRAKIDHARINEINELSEVSKVVVEIPLGRAATIDDVAEAIAFLASDRAAAERCRRSDRRSDSPTAQETRRFRHRTFARGAKLNHRWNKQN